MRIAEFAKSHPEKTAIVDQDGYRQTSYEELDVMASRVAHLLQDSGIKTNDLVPILLPRDVRYVAALLAVIRIGAAAVPLNPAYPQERINYIKSDCSALVSIDEDFFEHAQRLTPEEKIVEPAALDCALVTYTSGSTGKPKGVVQSWTGLMAGLERIRNISALSSEDQIACTAPFSFIALLLDLLTPLYSGATVHILSNEKNRDVQKIADYIADNSITGIFISPQLLKNFKNRSQSLRYVLTGSERLSKVAPDHYQLYNVYGMSEIPLTITSFQVDRAYENTPIGTVVEGLEILLVSEDGVPGDEGEICVSGDIFLGYLNLPEETENAFSLINGKRFFHTGDLARRLPDGNLEYINRKDWMVKVNGQRVELGEIEHAMAGFQGITTAVVKAFENEYGQAYLCGYYKAEGRVEEHDLRAWLNGLLPEYMVPLFLVELDAFPLNPNGKIDRLSLAKPDASLFQAIYQAPENDTQMSLCRGFEDTLKLEKVGIHDDFFAMGGDSIKAVILVDICGVPDLEVMDIFQGRTPARIAKQLEIRRTTQTDNADLFMLTDATPGLRPLSNSQLGVYLSCSQAPDSTLYNIPCRFRFNREPGIDVDRLQRAIRSVVDAYPVFRTKTELSAGDPALVFDASIPCDITVKQVSEEKIDIFSRDFVRPFDLSDGPLFRFEIVRTEDHDYLFMDVHHIIFDGASADVFLRQLTRAYDGDALLKEEVSTFQLAESERRFKDSASYQAAHDYFASFLDGNEVDSNPLFDHTLTSDVSDAPALRHYHVLNDALSVEAVEHCVRKARVTEGTLFLGAFAYTLAKFTGQTESLFATVNNGRHDPRLKNSIGMLVRTIPVYVQFDERQQISAALQNIQEHFYQSMCHDGFPFSEMANEFGIKADILYVYQAETLNSLRLGDADVPLDNLETGYALANLSVMVFRRGGGYAVSIDYRSDLYDSATVKRLVTLFEDVLRSFVNGGILGEIQLLSETDELLLDRFNNTERPYDDTCSVVDLLRQQANRTADKVAVVYREKQLTYADLDRSTDRLATYIRGLGIGREDVVSVLIPRNEFMPLASIGVSKAGAAYQPLDPSYPPERLSFMVNDASAKLLIVDESLLGLLPDYTGPVLLTKDIGALPDQECAFSGPSHDDLFILLYTSGTTGQPKGCMLEHKNLVAFCHWYCRYYELNEKSRVTAYASYGFDANMMDMYPVLVSGGTLYIIDDEIRLELDKLNEYFRDHGLTHAFMTTQVGRQFALSTKQHTLTCLSMGGEKLVPFAPPKDLRVFNLYGPTEATILTTAFEIDRLYANVPIGKPLDNFKLYIVDGQNRRVPIGVPGELLIAGVQVARGYLNRTELTEKVFQSNPFCSQNAYDRVYRTGDVVRMLPDGNVEFVGRRDSQVKIRGFRIELTEVEAVIRQFPGIQDATVSAIETPADGKQIVAYVVSSETVDVQALNAFILTLKPPYMVPSATVQIDAIPLNPNGKVDRRKLPAPESAPAAAEPSGHIMNVLEKQIVEAVQSVLGETTFSINTNLMMVGLTSLSAVRLSRVLHERFQFSPDVKALLKGYSILDIENDMLTHMLELACLDAPTSESTKHEKYPLTQTQTGIYLECQRVGPSDIYNIPMMLRLPSSLNVERLKAAVLAAVEAHPAMKCAIQADKQGNPYMIPHNDLDVDVEILEISEEELQVAKSSDLVTIFRLDTAPLFNFKIYKTGENLYLLIDIHHIIADGASLDILFSDISRAYKGEKLTQEAYSAFDLALDEVARRGGEAYEEAKAYYEGIFRDVDADSLPEPDIAEDENRPAISVAFHHRDERLMAKAVDAFCLEHQVTPNALFTAAFGLTLARWKHASDAVFTVIYHGRTDPRTASMVGMLVKTLPLYVNASEGDTVQFVNNVKEELAGLMAHDLYSFSEASRAFGIPSDIIFAYQGENLVGAEIAGHSAEIIALPLNTAKAPLNIDVFRDGEGYRFDWEYRADLYSEELIRSLADAVASAVVSLLEVEELAAVSLLSPASLALLERFNDTDWPLDLKPAHCLLEAQTARTPERIAVIAAEEKLTYEQLNTRANRVAHKLIEQGVKPNTIVGVMMRRSAFVYIARQGILKAGGAFLCIDPEYPDERIAYMIENSGMSQLLVTSEVMEQRGGFLKEENLSFSVIEDMLAEGDDRNPDIAVGPDDLCYCIYTSGSTGRPKGVRITQRNLVNFVDANPKNPEILGYTEYGSVSLALAAITFDVSIMEEFIPLAHGLTICMATEEEIHNPLALAQLMLENNVDLMSCTPSFLMNIIDLPQLQQALAGVASYDIGAEAFPAPLHDKIRAIREDAYIMNGYGPTETTISCTMTAITDSKNITIGKPASNVRAHMLDPHNNILPMGALGELTICGTGVGSGYIGLEDMTRDRFIRVDGLPAYKTGDLAQWTPEGMIRFRGRKDNQVKLRGLRIELDEIEAVINSFPDVLTSIVRVKGSETEQFLAAYFTASKTIDKTELTDYLSSKLTSYMVPGVLMQLEVMPLTASGKINAKALPELEYNAVEREYAEPENELERTFCDLFGEILGLPRVGANDNFFENGGTSLSASKVAIFALAKGHTITYADVFRLPTPRQLAQHAGGHEAVLQPNVSTSTRDDFDYAQLEPVLEGNCVENVDRVIFEDVGDILLTGATGFLGMHVLYEFLMNYSGKVYCLVRKGRSATVEQRLKTMLVYYFDQTFEELFEERIFCVEGDITDEAIVNSLKDISFRTLVNCAALVKHFVSDDSLERINVHGVQNLIALCQATGRRLIQVSTVSVAGEGKDGQPPSDKCIRECDLFFGQIINNAYIQSKFHAERIVLQGITAGLDAHIMRVGNLMSRDRDGEFQINFLTNGFMRQLRGYRALGVFPISLMNEPVEFSPIDSTASAILKLAGTGREFTVFHPYNNHEIYFSDVISAMNQCGLLIEVVTDVEFDMALKRALDVPNLSDRVSGLIAYLTDDAGGKMYMLNAENRMTTEILYRAGFKWPITGDRYLEGALRALDGLGFYEE